MKLFFAAFFFLLTCQIAAKQFGSWIKTTDNYFNSSIVQQNSFDAVIFPLFTIGLAAQYGKNALVYPLIGSDTFDICALGAKLYNGYEFTALNLTDFKSCTEFFCPTEGTEHYFAQMYSKQKLTINEKEMYAFLLNFCYYCGTVVSSFEEPNQIKTVDQYSFFQHTLHSTPSTRNCKNFTIQFSPEYCSNQGFPIALRYNLGENDALSTGCYCYTFGRLAFRCDFTSEFMEPFSYFGFRIFLIILSSLIIVVMLMFILLPSFFSNIFIQFLWMRKISFAQTVANIFNWKLIGSLSLLLATVFVIVESSLWPSIENYVERDMIRYRGLFYLCSMNCIYTSCFCLLINWSGIVYKLMAKQILKKLFQMTRIILILLNIIVILFFVVFCSIIYSIQSVTPQLLLIFFSIFEGIIIVANICFGFGNVAFGFLMYKAIQYSSNYVEMRRGIQHYSFVKFQISFGFTLLIHTITLCFILMQNVLSWDVVGVPIYLLTIPFSLLISIIEILLLMYAYTKGVYVQHMCCWFCVLINYSKKKHKYGGGGTKLVKFFAAPSRSAENTPSAIYSVYSSARSSVSNLHQDHHELIKTLEDFAQDSEEEEVMESKEYDMQDQSTFTDIVLDISSSTKSKSSSNRESLLQ